MQTRTRLDPRSHLEAAATKDITHQVPKSLCRLRNRSETITKTYTLQLHRDDKEHQLLLHFFCIISTLQKLKILLISS